MSLENVLNMHISLFSVIVHICGVCQAGQMDEKRDIQNTEHVLQVLHRFRPLNEHKPSNKAEFSVEKKKMF